jgi:CAAX prenyl protease-like protein
MSDSPSHDALPPARGREAILVRHPWVVFIVPFAVYMLATALEPSRDPPGWLAYRYYPVVYILKLALTLAAVLWVLPGYKKFPLRISPWSVVVGLVGVVLWVGLCELHIEQHALRSLGLERWMPGARPEYNPFEHVLTEDADWAWVFLATRFFGLALLVPLVEEFFLRGFLMRFFVAAKWQDVPFGAVTRASVVVAVVYAVLTHPGEMIAAALWFSLVTWLMVKTKNIWDCVLAHAVTNLLLGVYIVVWHRWYLW